MFYIQLIGILGFCIVVLSFYKKETTTILLYQITSNFVYAVHYFLLGGLSGAFCCFIGIFRNITLIKFNNKKIILPIFITIYSLITIIFYEDIYSILPMMANVSYLVGMTYKKKKILLKGALVSSSCWIMYAIFVSSYVSIVTELILLISNSIELIRIIKNSEKVD
ncbi:MAG: YgjV family protein [Bacilli bacterium]|nr:YgjV family protein [Bacilli bacterium]